MTDRMVLGIQGGSPVFRITKPGYDISSTDISKFIIREDSFTFHPVISGSRTFTGNGTVNVGVGGLSEPPFIILKSSDDALPTYWDYWAKLNSALNTLTIVNERNVSRTISFFVLAA